MTYVINNNSNIYNVQAQKASSISFQTGSGTYQDLDTSDITYNCDGLASKVIYEYTANFVRSGSAGGVLLAKLMQYNTSTSAWEIVSDSHYTTQGFSGNSSSPRNNYTFKYVLDSWSGNKQLKMQWKVLSGGMLAHHTESIVNLSDDSINNSYVTKPFLIIHSIK